jgi:predicted pyridoxine 5'-phosphate oxidase superfamily flavin-nucleotide-binding protein
MTSAARDGVGITADESRFHPGEQVVQARLGVRERIEQIGRRVIRDFMPDQHREFFEDLPFLLVGSQATSGEVWASLLAAQPGFVRAPTVRSLEVRARAFPGDPLAEQLRVGSPLGLLGIELPTRRRNRVNGRVVAADADRFLLAVEQSFGNCKQYIQARAGRFTPPGAAPQPLALGALLSPRALRVLKRSDTAFLATSSRAAARGGAEGVDVSHRGGPAGFVRARASDAGLTLILPDYSGNFLFNSFGNLEVNPRAGLLVIDFESGDVMSLTGLAHVIWEGPEVAEVPGAERLLEYRVERGLLWPSLAVGFSAAEVAPQVVALAKPSV